MGKGSKTYGQQINKTVNNQLNSQIKAAKWLLFSGGFLQVLHNGVN
ncbi:hypothetical protein AO382_0712 [Moraxella catarrhalis]|uniref:Uncharacterized protein n=1 Tax=Moraxella catarrhalis TaxID=480 RepID=A0A7Z0UZE3_MORCA|nr:hypothetical protein AO382_0712 [Moraxella catarrhalis]